MNILQIEYFLALARYRSFKKTSEALYVSQPAVSMQIAQLEKEWNILLFYRKYKEVELTPAGKLMHDMLRNSAADFKDTLSRAQRTNCTRKVIIHMGIPECAIFGNLTEIISGFQKENPEVMLILESIPLSQLTFENTESKYDLVINQEYLLGKQGLHTLPFAQTEHILLISQEHELFQRKAEVTISDLSGEKLFIPASSSNSKSVDYCRYICANHGFIPEEVTVLPNVNSVLLASKMNFGVSLLDSLVSIPEEYKLKKLASDIPTSYQLAWRADTPNSYVERLARKIHDVILPAPV